MISIDSKRILAEVKANIAKLNGCEGPHLFEPYAYYGNDPTGLPRDFKCKRCGGVTSSINAHWYNDGHRHAWQKAVAVLRELTAIGDAPLARVVNLMEKYAPEDPQ